MYKIFLLIVLCCGITNTTLARTQAVYRIALDNGHTIEGLFIYDEEIPIVSAHGYGQTIGIENLLVTIRDPDGLVLRANREVLNYQSFSRDLAIDFLTDSRTLYPDNLIQLLTANAVDNDIYFYGYENNYGTLAIAGLGPPQGIIDQMYPLVFQVFVPEPLTVFPWIILGSLIYLRFR